MWESQKDGSVRIATLPCLARTYSEVRKACTSKLYCLFVETSTDLLHHPLPPSLVPATFSSSSYSTQILYILSTFSCANHRLPRSSSSSLSFISFFLLLHLLHSPALHSFPLLFLFIHSLFPVSRPLSRPFLDCINFVIGDATWSTLLRLWYESILPSSELPCPLWGQILLEWVQLPTFLLHWAR